MAPSQPLQYRPIHPAPVRSATSGATSGAPGSSWLSTKGLTKRIKAVTQACHTCRRNKAKCDGVRPRCRGCISRGLPCGYEGEAGQSRQAALRARLDALEKLVCTLQSCTDDEAEALLHRLRAANDGVSLPNADSESPSAGSATLLGSSASSECSFAGPSARAFARASSKALVGAPLQSSTSSSQSVDLTGLLNLTLPGANTTWAGIQSFFSACGKLFHIFSQQQLEVYHRMVFNVDGQADTSQKLAICCLAAVAAVGIQYNPGDFEKGLEVIFHDVSRHFFSEVMEERPLDTIKICALFAMYNILQKTTVALAYVEVGLSMSKRQSQSTGVCHPSMLSSEEWVDFRRTWRALLFFSSFLASTLGYISGAQESDFTKLLPVAEEDDDSYNAELGEIIQAEMTKISLLKAGILRNHLAVQELTTLGMDGIIRELQDWHSHLPETIKLRSLWRDDWPPIVRWSIYHMHILYHGAFMLVYRRIAAHCIQLQRRRGDVTLATSEPTLLNLVEQGVTSARDTTRVVSLLFAEQGVFQRCWIVIFQAHTACVVMLHCVAQKQLHRFPPSSWAEDMKRAQQCLDILSYCGANDPVALRFCVRLSGIFNILSRYVPEGQTATMQRVADWVPPPPPPPDAMTDDMTDDNGDPPTPTIQEPHPIEYLFRIPPSPNPQLLRLSYHLLFALCRPWSDTGPATALTSPTSLSNSTRSPTSATSATMAADDSTTLDGSGSSVEGGDDSSNGEGGNNPAQLLERLDWDFGKVMPFRWDTDGMGMLKPGEMIDPSCFLDSEAPSGWSAAEDLEEGEGVEAVT